MTCIKTGADVHLPQHGCTVHGDLFKVGDVYILSLGRPFSQCTSYEKPMWWNIRAEEFEHVGYYVIAFTDEQASDFFYEGRELK